MLWDLEKDKEITSIPHKKDYDLWMSRLTPSEIQDIKEEFLRMIEGLDIVTSGWIPGPDWTNTPLQLIHDKACITNWDSARKCYGIMVWEIMMEHDDVWGFGKYTLDDKKIGSMTYFRLKCNSQF